MNSLKHINCVSCGTTLATSVLTTTYLTVTTHKTWSYHEGMPTCTECLSAILEEKGAKEEASMSPTEAYEHPNDEKRTAVKRYAYYHRTNAEWVVDIFLAHAEAERDVDKMLDVLRDPEASSRKKAQAKKFLYEHSHEYAELCKQRDRISAGLMRVPV